jgi:hypothetical protein
MNLLFPFGYNNEDFLQTFEYTCLTEILDVHSCYVGQFHDL